MNLNLFRIWLPASLGLHLLLIPALQRISYSASPGNAPRTMRVTLLPPVAEAPKPQPPEKPKPKPVTRPPVTRPVVMKRTPKPVTPITPKIPLPGPKVPDPKPAPETKFPGHPTQDMLKSIPKLSPTDNSPQAVRQIAPKVGPPTSPRTTFGDPNVPRNLSLPEIPSVAPALITSPRGSLPVPAYGMPGGIGDAPIGINKPPSTPFRMPYGTDPTSKALQTVAGLKPGETAPNPTIGQLFQPGKPGGPLAPPTGVATGLDMPKGPIGTPGGSPTGHGNIGPATGVPGGTGPGGGAGGWKNGPSYGPRAIGGTKPKFPAIAVAEGLHGTVVVSMEVTEDGTVIPSSVKYVQRSYADSLDNSAAYAARSWKFAPAVKNGVRVKDTATLKFDFTNPNNEVVVTQQ